ncbi:hypothetical protein AGLY_013429 [Aphis glycines]|uniref:Uncharacterized protein n=1 Tax=Aphis glycines TaxID=307491 RepID=A0A6G0T6A5_APHGL|nr:hypothetical protein AGLY_013429 [Aphis glycines]
MLQFKTSGVVSDDKVNIFEAKSKKCPYVFKTIGKNHKKVTKNGNFYAKPAIYRNLKYSFLLSFFFINIDTIFFNSKYLKIEYKDPHELILYIKIYKKCRKLNIRFSISLVYDVFLDSKWINKYNDFTTITGYNIERRLFACLSLVEIWRFHVSLLSNVTPRYFTSVAKYYWDLLQSIVLPHFEFLTLLIF